MPTVKCWLHEVFRSLRPGVQPHFFLSNLLMTSLLATAFNPKEAQSYLWRGQWSMDSQAALRDGLIQPANRLPVAGSAIRWFDKATRTRTNLGIHFLEYVLSAPPASYANFGIAMYSPDEFAWISTWLSRSPKSSVLN